MRLNYARTITVLAVNAERVIYRTVFKDGTVKPACHMTPRGFADRYPTIAERDEELQRYA